MSVRYTLESKRFGVTPGEEIAGRLKPYMFMEHYQIN